MAKEKISIIVPVYNVQNYLNRCVDSILNQTYKNIEIILVDDGSIDNSKNICDEYVKRDKRIITIHRKNGGLSDARNAGIKQAKGKYITFVDSDDWIESNYIELLYNNLILYDADMSQCMLRSTNGIKKVNNCKSFIPIVYTKKQAISNLLIFKNLTTSACGKLYKSELFKEIKFPIGKIFEDIPVAYEILFKIKKMVFINIELYNYFYREGSISKNSFSEKRLDSIKFIESAVKKIKRIYPDLTKICNIALFRVNYGIYSYYIDDKNFLEYKQLIWKNIKKYRNAVILSKYSGIKNKLKALSTYFGDFGIKVIKRR